MQKFSDYVTDRKGNVVSTASVLVKELGASIPATIYAGNSTAQLQSNPISVDSLGGFSFYAPNGRYSIEVYIESKLFTIIGDILLEDPQDATPEVIDGGLIKNSNLEDVTVDGAKTWLAVDSIAQLRAIKTSGPVKYVATTGYYEKGDGGHGLYYVPSNFAGLANNDSTVIGADDGGFFCLNHNGIVGARQGGLRADRVTDDSAKLLTLATALSTANSGRGIAITLGPRERVYIGASLTLPTGTRIKGSSGVGSPAINTTAGDIVFGGSSIIIAPGASITLKGSCRVSEVIVASSAITGNLPNASTFAGTGFIAGGDDIRFDYCGLFGFSTAYLSDGYARPSFDHCYGDCINGLDIRNCFDVPRFNHCHFWPWLTVAAGNVGLGTAHAAYRAGRAISLDNVSWPEVTEVFTFGYAIGVYTKDCPNPVIRGQVEGMRDAANNLVDTIGVQLNGNTANGDICVQSAHQQIGVHQVVNAGLHNKIHHGMFRDMSNCGIAIVSGNATISENSTRGLDTGVGGNGVRVLAGAGQVSIPTHYTESEGQGIQINNTTTWVGQVTSVNTIIPVNTLAQQFQIVAAATLPVTGASEHWYVTGTTGITNFRETHNGHRITVVFTQALTLTDGTGAGALRVGGTLAVTAGQTLQFVCNGITGAMTWRRV